MTISSHQFFRHDVSSYYCVDFKQREQAAIERSFPNISTIHRLEELKLNKDIVLVTSSHTKIDQLPRDLIDHTCLIIHANSGYDNFSAQFVQKATFPIVLGNEIRAHAVATSILSGLFSLLSPIPNRDLWDPERLWPRQLLNKATVLIVGHGHIGRIVHDSLRPLAKEIRLYDPYQGFPTLDPVGAHIIILACSSNLYNHHLIDQNFLDAVDPNFILINTARGKLVEIKSLYNKLANNSQAKAYLDVFDDGPRDFKLFRALPNIVLTSHAAGYDDHIHQKIINFELKVLKDFTTLPINSFYDVYAQSLLQSKLRGNLLI